MAVWAQNNLILFQKEIQMLILLFLYIIYASTDKYL